MAHPSLRACPVNIVDILLTPMVLRATWGTVKGIFLNKTVIWLGQSRQFSTLTSVEIVPERHFPCRLDLSGVISPWCPVDEDSWRLLLLLLLLKLIIFFTVWLPHLLYICIHYLPEQLDLQSRGFSQINIVFNPLGINVLCSHRPFTCHVWAAHSKTVGTTVDCGLQFLCGVTDVSWWKGKKNKQGYSFFKASIASPVTLWHSLGYSTMTVRQHCVPTSASSWLLVSEDALPRCSPGDNLCYQVQAIHFPPEPSCSRDLGFWLNKNLH